MDQTDLNQVANILGVNIHRVTKIQALDRIEGFLKFRSFNWIVTINPEIILQSQRYKDYRYLLKSASLAVADGIGTVWASRLLGTPLPERITGVELCWEIARMAAQHQKRLFLLGGQPSATEKTQEILKKQFPNLIVASDAQIQYHDKRTIQTALNRIKNFQAQVVLVALGVPRQEEFIVKYLATQPFINLAMGVGGSFDILGGLTPRAPSWYQRLGLEWLWRWRLEPWRAGRMWQAVVVFPIQIVYWFWRMNTTFRKNVLALIYNSTGDILIVERCDTPDHWQLPQGGVEKGESLKQAFKREMQEELGVNQWEIAKIIPNFYRYPWPKWHQLNQGYKGQNQALVVAKYTGKDEDFHLDQRELNQVKWINPKEAHQLVSPFRREALFRALAIITR